MPTIKRNKNSGYSLVEILVYIFIFSILSIVVIRSIIVMMRSFSETVVTRDFLNTSFVMERISREIRNSISIDPASTFDTSPGYLKINSMDASDNSQTLEFKLTGTNITLKKDGTLVGNLNASNIKITSLVFRQITTSVGKAVKIEMSAQDTKDSSARTESFYDTVELRGALGS